MCVSEAVVRSLCVMSSIRRQKVTASENVTAGATEQRHAEGAEAAGVRADDCCVLPVTTHECCASSGFHQAARQPQITTAELPKYLA